MSSSQPLTPAAKDTLVGKMAILAALFTVLALILFSVNTPAVPEEFDPDVCMDKTRPCREELCFCNTQGCVVTPYTACGFPREWWDQSYTQSINLYELKQIIGMYPASDSDETAAELV